MSSNANYKPAKHPTGHSKPILMPQEKAFVEAYVTPGTPAHLNATRAYMKAYNVPYESANATGCKVLDRPRIQKSLREMLKETDITDKVRQGLEQIVDGFVRKKPKYRAREFMEAAKLVTEVTGDKAPDRSIVMNVTPEMRQQEYADIVKLVRKTEPELLLVAESKAEKDTE